MLQDLEALVRMQTFPADPVAGSTSRARIHYCWDAALGRPCCDDEEDMREKFSVSQVNFHLSRTFEQVSLARWTHVANARKRLLVGMGCQRLYLSALVLAASRSISPGFADMSDLLPVVDINFEEVGAGDQDVQATHQTRCARLCQWLQSKSFWFTLPITEVAESVIDGLMYRFFGHDGEIATVGEICHKERSPVALALGQYWALLKEWRPAKDGVWKVVALCGWTDFQDTDARRCARRTCLSIAASLVLRFEVKFSELPWTLHRLTSSNWSDSEKHAVCQHLLSARPCDVPLFAEKFRARFPDAEAMLSPTTLGAIRSFERGKLFSTKGSEIGPAGERQALAAAAAPGRSWVHHCRRNVLQRARAIHLAGGGDDPLKED